MTADDAVRIAALPALRWLREPESWQVTDGGALHAVAGARTIGSWIRKARPIRR